jgi:hypothetical protein
MTTRLELIQCWQTELAENERLLSSGSPRVRWLRQIRVRLFRFLLACYGGGEWHGDVSEATADASQDQSAARAPLIDLAHAAGAPPKSAEQIRATLKAVHAVNPGLDRPGPLMCGLHEQDWIVIESFRRAADARRLRRELFAHAIASRQFQRKRTWYVLVHVGDLDNARRLTRVRSSGE